MGTENTETTQQTGQGAADVAQASSENTEQTSTQQTMTDTGTSTQQVTHPVSVQERIDRMYARLQSERAARIKAENERDAVKIIQRQDVQTDETTEVEEKTGLTEQEVEKIIQKKEQEKEKNVAFEKSERRVLERHSDALNQDGSFNMDDPFVKAYIEIGRKNPNLIYMENGPELAEAMAEKLLGTEYNKGRRDEANTTTATTNSFTATSTVANPPVNQEMKLSAEEKKIANKMGLSDKDYIKYVGNKTDKGNAISTVDWTPKKKGGSI